MQLIKRVHEKSQYYVVVSKDSEIRRISCILVTRPLAQQYYEMRWNDAGGSGRTVNEYE